MYATLTTLVAVIAVVAAHDEAPQQQRRQSYYLPTSLFIPIRRQVVASAPAPAPAPSRVAVPVYRYVAPSPLAPPCPNGFTCCNGVKHYDPRGDKKCCGTAVYSPIRQACVRGNIVSIVQAPPPPTTTPLPIFIQQVTLTCQGLKYKVPYPDYACCGPTVYNKRTSTCSLDESGNPKPTTTTTQAPPTKPPTKILTCENHRFSVPTIDFQFYACCRHQAYFWPRESCVNGEIDPPRPVTTTISPTPADVPILLVCDGVQHWIRKDQRHTTGCCGQNTYDTRVEICRSPSSSSSRAAQSCPPGYICCENSPPVDNSDGRLACCPGIGPYNPSFSQCPN